METFAVVLKEPGSLALDRVALAPMGADDVVVDVAWSGISTGTERLLWSGAMPPFPGMGYPLVPGYETVGRVVDAGADARKRVGEYVFVPGARCFEGVRALFGGAAGRLIAPQARAHGIDAALGERGVLMALAATARHAMAAPGARTPELIVGHGVLGRLLARLTCAAGGAPPTVWETDAGRRAGAVGYAVVDPETDPRRDYASIYDCSGDSDLLDALIGRLAPGGEIVLAGFYKAPVHFAFPPAFMREARLRVAAEWREPDLAAVKRAVAEGALSLDGLVTHVESAERAPDAYRTAFTDAACLKMGLDWRTRQ
ncbi:MAG: chlorophyll synthesis pathway protein BchC [Tagaea sp.]